MNQSIKNALVSSFFFAFAAACTTTVVDDAAEPEALEEQIAAENSGAEPRIEPAKIQGAMRSQFFTHAKACYETLREDVPDAGGKIVLRFVILDGAASELAIEQSEGNLGDPSFETCMHDAMAKVAFPVADGEVTVSYPVLFSHDE